MKGFVKVLGRAFSYLMTALVWTSWIFGFIAIILDIVFMVSGLNLCQDGAGPWYVPDSGYIAIKSELWYFALNYAVSLLPVISTPFFTFFCNILTIAFFISIPIKIMSFMSDGEFEVSLTIFVVSIVMLAGYEMVLILIYNFSWGWTIVDHMSLFLTGGMMASGKVFLRILLMAGILFLCSLGKRPDSSDSDDGHGIIVIYF